MKQKVAQPLIEILHTRVTLSKELKVFSLTDIAKEWGITHRTLQRYEYPEQRENSRLVAKRATDFHKTIDKTLCQLCPMKLQGHPRCESCTMLVHGEPECSCSSCVVLSNPITLILRINNQ